MRLLVPLLAMGLVCACEDNARLPDPDHVQEAEREQVHIVSVDAVLSVDELAVKIDVIADASARPDELEFTGVEALRYSAFGHSIGVDRWALGGCFAWRADHPIRVHAPGLLPSEGVVIRPRAARVGDIGAACGRFAGCNHSRCERGLCVRLE